MLKIQHSTNCVEEEEGLDSRPILKRLERSDGVPGLPENFEVGEATRDGDCFFDAVAQGLRQLKTSEDFTVKSLREVCREFAKSQLINDQSWLREVLERENETLEYYIPRIEFTAEDIKQGHEIINILRLTSPIWGRTEFEGRIICKEYNVKLHVIEKYNVGEKEIWTNQIVDESGSRSVDNIDYDEANVIHIVNKRKLHFEPILHKARIVNMVQQENHQSSSDSESMEVGGDSSDVNILVIGIKDINVQDDETTTSQAIFEVIPVPGDGNCLFTSIALAFLMPAIYNERDFKERFVKLFDSEDPRKIQLVKTELQNWNGESSSELDNLIRTFRARVFDNALTNQEFFETSSLEVRLSDFESSYFSDGTFKKAFTADFKNEIDVDKLEVSSIREVHKIQSEIDKIPDKNKVKKFLFEEYFKYMRNSQSPSGKVAERAIGMFLNSRIYHVSLDSSVTKSSEASYNEEIYLYPDTDHYQFCLVKLQSLKQSVKNNKWEEVAKYLKIGIKAISEGGNLAVKKEIILDYVEILKTTFKIYQEESKAHKNSSSQLRVEEWVERFSDMQKQLEDIGLNTVCGDKISKRYKVPNKPAVISEKKCSNTGFMDTTMKEWMDTIMRESQDNPIPLFTGESRQMEEIVNQAQQEGLIIFTNLTEIEDEDLSHLKNSNSKYNVHLYRVSPSHEFHNAFNAMTKDKLGMEYKALISEDKKIDQHGLYLYGDKIKEDDLRSILKNIIEIKRGGNVSQNLLPTKEEGYFQDEQRGIEYVKASLGIEDQLLDREIKKFLKILKNNVPLTEQAISFIKKQQLSSKNSEPQIDEYLQKLQELNKKEDILEEKEKYIAAKVWALTKEEIAKADNGESAIEIAKFLAFCNNKANLVILGACFDLTKKTLLNSLNLLTEYSLIPQVNQQDEAKSITLPPLLAAGIRKQAEHNDEY